MRVLFSYLPVNVKGYFCVSQQRFSKVKKTPELIFPILPASVLTILRREGHEVFFLDAILRRLDRERFIEELALIKPDLLVFETKTPVIKENWEMVNYIRGKYPALKIAAVGDHVSVLPEETLLNSAVDYVVTGGDYDAVLPGLCSFIAAPGKNAVPPGVYYRKGEGILNSGKAEFVKDLDTLPFIDREIIPWHDYREGWRLKERFFYISASRGCVYKCTFCSWAQMLYGGTFRQRSVDNVMGELRYLKEKYAPEEIFFDDDTFTVNRKWTEEFCRRLIEEAPGFIWSCNGRVDNVDEGMLGLMKKSGCRMIKFGIESANPDTLVRIRKGYTVEDVRKAFAAAKRAGLMTHGTVMLGYPWETEKDMLRTVQFVKSLAPDQVQFSFVIAYPGTQLYKEALENNWLRFRDGEWEKLDMSLPSLVNPHLGDRALKRLYRHAWMSFYLSPRYMSGKILGIRSPEELWYFARNAWTVLRGHIG